MCGSVHRLFDRMRREKRRGGLDVCHTGIKNAESCEVEVSMAGKMSMKMGEEAQDLDMKMDMKGTSFQDPLKMKITGSVAAMG